MEVFPIIPASAKPLWFIGVICLLLAAILLALAYTAYASRHSRVELGHDSIRLVGDFWGRSIPRQTLIPSQARILDLHKNSEYAPKKRTLGTGLPGYASGWFRLSNGEKALIYVTSRTRVVYVPTTAGYALLLSVREPERFVTALGGSTS